MKIIKVKIPLRGMSTGAAKITVDANGFEGVSCRDATKVLLNALGTVVEEIEKPEMFHVAEAEEHLKLHEPQQ